MKPKPTIKVDPVEQTECGTRKCTKNLEDVPTGGLGRRQRLKKLVERLGTFGGFMSPEELEAQRALDLSQ